MVYSRGAGDHKLGQYHCQQTLL